MNYNNLGLNYQQMKEIMFQLIMEFLKDNGCIESFIQVEKQSKILLKEYPKEIQFFKKIMLKGDFSEAVQFIWTFEHKIDRDTLSSFTLKILKQKLYELLENPEQQELKNLFEKEIVDHCSQEEYQQLFTHLTCRSVKEIPGMNEWTPIKGRYSCFEEIVPYLENIFVNSMRKSASNQRALPFKLQEAIKSLLNSQNSKNFSANPYSQIPPSKLVEKQENKIIIKDSIQKQISHYSQASMNNRSKTPKEYQYDLPQEMDVSESRVEKSEAFIEKSMDSSSINRKINTYVNPSAGQIRTKQIQAFKEDRNEVGSNIMSPNLVSNMGSNLMSNIGSNKSYTPNYLKEFQREKELNESQMLQEEVKRNIAYLDQNNDSEVFKEEQHENFTFSNGADESAYYDHPKKIFKLTTISDPKAIRTCQFSPSGMNFALGTNSSYLKIFDIDQLFKKNQPKELLPQYQIPQLHSKSIFSLDWSVNEKSIVTCSNDLTIKITDFAADTYQFSAHKTNIIGRHQSCIRMVKFNGAETKVVSCGDDCLIKIWDIGRIKKCTTLKGHEQGVSAFKFAYNEGDSIIYSVGKDSVIRKWDIRVGECVNTSSQQDSQMTYIANNTDKIVVSHKNGYVSFFDDKLQLQNSFKIHEQEIRSIDGNNYDDSLLTASFDGHISIFNQKTAETPNYHQHNQIEDDKVVFATFLNHPQLNGFASSSTMGLCNIFSYE